MQRRLPLYGLFFVLAVIILESCSNTRFLADDQLLYTGRNKVIVISPEKFKKQKTANQVIQSMTSSKPNNALVGKRLLPPGGLWIYNYMKPKKNRKLSNWIYKTFSVEPVLVSQVNPDIRCQKLKSELFNIGFFHTSVWAKIDTSPRNPRKAKITYTVFLNHPYQYNKVSFAPPSDAVDSLISSFHKDLSIKPDDVFDLETVKSETKKMTALVVDKGYYYFNSNYIKWTADTTLAPYRIDLRISKSNELPFNASRNYTMNNITVHIINPVDSVTLTQFEDTIFYDGIRIVSLHNYLKPQVITRSIYFRKGDTYSATKYQQTMKRLNGYGVFKFINMQFIPCQDSMVHQLDLLITLTPMKEISLDLEVNVVSKSNGFSGPGLIATLAHGNLSRGANKLQLKLNGGIEWQWSNSSSSTLGTTSYNIGVSSSIVFPKVLKPFKLFNTKNFNVPQTSLTLGDELMNKIQYYKMSSVNLGLGYQWRKLDKITHNFYPLFFNSVALLQTTPEFDSILNANPYIRKSFEEQFIAGMKYDFIYDNNSKKPVHGIYFQAGVSTAGNMLGLVKSASSTEQERPYSVAGNVYSQFVKLSTDIRYSWNVRNHNLVFRLYSGAGIPYRNSTIMPYVEQFYSGGSNSIRAFISRSLGPGSYKSDVTSDIIDQTGDIKLEGNVEYRFKMSKVVHGALFLDAGNVWLLNKDESRPGAEFIFSTFVNQLAVGTGVGLRFDFNFFILRTDFGLPLRMPYATNGSNWLTSTKDIFSGYVFSLAIGYPF
jgi:outer membrane protein insertion porin family